MLHTCKHVQEATCGISASTRHPGSATIISVLGVQGRGVSAQCFLHPPWGKPGLQLLAPGPTSLPFIQVSTLPTSESQALSRLERGLSVWAAFGLLRVVDGSGDSDKTKALQSTVNRLTCGLSGPTPVAIRKGL